MVGHDPGKIMADLAVCVALGGRCLSDLSLLRCEGEVFGPVASDPTVSRLVGTLAYHVEAVEAAVNRARKTVRQRVWALAGEHSPTAGVSAERPLVIDVDPLTGDLPRAALTSVGSARRSKRSGVSGQRRRGTGRSLQFTAARGWGDLWGQDLGARIRVMRAIATNKAATTAPM